MELEEIVKMYGTKSDYYEQLTGRIFHFTQMEYHLFDNTTHVPVSKNGTYIGIVKLKGNYTKGDK